jgi:hypothetical protein
MMVALAGCQAVTPVKAPIDESVVTHPQIGGTGQAQNTATAGNAGTLGANGQATAGDQTAPTAQAGANGQAGTTDAATQAGQSAGTAQAAALEGAGPYLPDGVAGGVGTGAQTPTPGANAPMFFSAASGGQYVSPDGSVKMTIPPGTLSQDTNISVTLRDDSGVPITDYVPGIHYSLDLGGAVLAPDHNLMITAKLDPRFVEAQKKRDPVFSPDKYNLSVDAKGDWFMTMTIHGPTTSVPAMPTQPVDLNAIMMAEFGSLPLPGGVTPRPAARKILSHSSQADCQTWVSTIGPPVPVSYNTWYGREGTDWDCGAMDGVSWFMNVFYDAVVYHQAPCDGGVQPSPPPPPTPVGVSTHVTFVSDDPAVNGHDAAGVNARFSFVWSPQNGPADVVTDGNGNASSYTMPGGTMMVTPYMALGPTSGATASATVQANMAAVETRLPKYSPQIVVNLTSEARLPDHVDLTYTLDGAVRHQTIATPVGATSARAAFYVIVPDDNNHTFALTDAAVGDLHAALPLQAPFPVHRTWQYPLNIKLLNLAAK